MLAEKCMVEEEGICFGDRRTIQTLLSPGMAAQRIEGPLSSSSSNIIIKDSNQVTERN